MKFLNPFDNYREYIVPEDVIKQAHEGETIFFSPVKRDYSEWQRYYVIQDKKHYAEYSGRVFCFPQNVSVA